MNAEIAPKSPNRRCRYLWKDSRQQRIVWSKLVKTHQSASTGVVGVGESIKLGVEPRRSTSFSTDGVFNVQV